jgi:hypothetical protein
MASGPGSNPALRSARQYPLTTFPTSACEPGTPDEDACWISLLVKNELYARFFYGPSHRLNVVRNRVSSLGLIIAHRAQRDLGSFRKVGL